MDDLVAFGEVIVGNRTLTANERRLLAEYIELRTEEGPERLSLYRTAASTLALAAGRPFASLELRQRRELIESEGLAGRRAPSEEALGSLSGRKRQLRTRIVPDLIRGYYRFAGGWGVVGYMTFPGQCGDLMRYTRPEN